VSLDRSVFVREMTLLHERFGRSPNKQVMHRYYETLRDRLTTEQFEHAARVVFDNDQFWPAPMRFVEVIQGDADENAANAWTMVLEYARTGAGVHTSDPHVVAGLRAAGGINTISRTEGAYALDVLRRSFQSAFKSSLTGQEIKRLLSAGRKTDD